MSRTRYDKDLGRVRARWASWKRTLLFELSCINLGIFWTVLLQMIAVAAPSVGISFLTLYFMESDTGFIETMFTAGGHIAPFIVIPLALIACVVTVILAFQVTFNMITSKRYERTRIISEIGSEWILQDFFHRKSIVGKDVSQLRLAFADMLTEHVAQDETISSALADLRALRAQKQWKQLSEDPRFSYQSAIHEWQLDTDELNYGTRLDTSSLTDAITSSNDKGYWEALIALADNIHQSEHYGLDDFLIMVDAPLVFEKSNQAFGRHQKNLEPLSNGNMPRRSIPLRTSYWSILNARLMSLDEEGFHLHSEILTTMVSNEIEDMIDSDQQSLAQEAVSA